MTKIQYENLTIRQAEVADAKQLAAWWNDGAVMAHAGFPNGLGTTEEEVVKGLRNGLLFYQSLLFFIYKELYLYRPFAISVIWHRCFPHS